MIIDIDGIPSIILEHVVKREKDVEHSNRFVDCYKVFYCGEIKYFCYYGHYGHVNQPWIEIRQKTALINQKTQQKNPNYIL